MPSASLKLLNLNQDHPLKNVFWSNLFKILVMITSVIEMLELQKTLVTWPHVQYNFLLVRSWTEIMTSK